MATAPVIEHEDQTSIVVAVAQNPALVLVDTGKRDDLFAHIRSEIEAFIPDVTTAKGRDAIKSFAYKITRTKTAIDDAGKKLNEDARARINVVDAARRDAKAALQAMADQVRQPLTEWEEAENVRISGCRDAIAQFKRDAVVTLDDTAASVRQRGMDVWNTAVDEARFGDLYGEAIAAKEAAVASLKSALDRLTREEADKAELDKLRAEKEAREAEEAEAKAAEEEFQRRRADADALIKHCRECGYGIIGGQSQALGLLIYELENKIVIPERLADFRGDIELARDEALERVRRMMAEAAEQKRIDEEKAEAARIEKAKEEAAQAERDRIQQKHDEELAAEKRRADKVEAEAAAKRAEEKRIADEQAAREKDKENRRRVKTAAKEAIMSCGASEDVAQKIVLAIIAGEVPAVSLRF